MKKYIRKYIKWVVCEPYYYKVTIGETLFAIVILPFAVTIFILTLPVRLLVKWLNN